MIVIQEDPELILEPVLKLGLTPAPPKMRLGDQHPVGTRPLCSLSHI